MNEIMEYKEVQIIDKGRILGVEFNVYGDYENPLILAKDVATWIDYDISNVSKLVSLVDESEKTARKINTSGSNYKTEAWFLTEDGIYEILMQSRKPIAKIVKKEVKNILKTIRKHGAYLTPQKIEEVLLSPDTLIQLAKNLKAEQEKRTQLEEYIEEKRPLTVLGASVANTSDLILVGELAKILNQNKAKTGERRFYEYLRENGYLIKNKLRSDYNLPTQKSMDLGLFRIVESSITNGEDIRIYKTAKVTGKGQKYFTDKLLANVAKHEQGVLVW